MRFEVSGYAADGVCFAEHAGESLPRGEDFDGCLCGGGLAGHTASVWRRSFPLRAMERRARREEEERRTPAATGMEAIGVVVGLRLGDLQLLLMQVVHFVLRRGVDWVVGGVM